VLPPRRLRLCFAEARREGRLLRLSLADGARRGAGSLHWIEGESAPMVGAVAGAC
jgi:hypothetical protein